MKDLKIKFKTNGRSYAYAGQDLTESPWYLVDKDGNEYDDQNEYEKHLTSVKKAKALVDKKETAKREVTKKEG